MSANSINLIRLLAGGIFSIPLAIVLSFFLWLSFQEIIVSIRNYNFPRAATCSYANCGFYYHNSKDALSKGCLNPFVPEKKFIKLSVKGNQPGCRRSFQVRENGKNRKPSSEYKQEFLATYTAFHISKVWWRMITILAATILYFWSLPTADKLWENLFGF